jgi:uncharacterized paraquat-inducible protein A
VDEVRDEISRRTRAWLLNHADLPPELKQELAEALEGKKLTIVEDFGWGFCKRCHEHKDLRFGVCFRCATEAEKEADLELLGIRDAEGDQK